MSTLHDHTSIFGILFLLKRLVLVEKDEPVAMEVDGDEQKTHEDDPKEKKKDEVDQEKGLDHPHGNSIIIFCDKKSIESSEYQPWKPIRQSNGSERFTG